MNYVMTETHTHTHYSDGRFSTKELLDAASEYGYKVLIMTDHNTVLPCHEAKLYEKENPLIVVPGMEWTTFFGHMLVTGIAEYVDWTKATPTTIDASLKRIKSYGGLTTIAHPFAVGSPICTGCAWEFQVQDYHLIDFIEVWNHVCPDDSFRSEKAYQMWIDLLKKGYRIRCSSGRDWHFKEKDTYNTGLTYINLQENSKEGVLSALKKGDSYISLAPRMQLSIEQDHQVFTMGDTISSSKPTTIRCTVSPTEVKKLAYFGAVPTVLKVISNDDTVTTHAIGYEQEIVLTHELPEGYVRFEVWGEWKNRTDRLIISNPFYVTSM